MNTLFFLLAMIFTAVIVTLQVMRDQRIPTLRGSTVLKIIGWSIAMYALANVATRLAS